MLELGVTGIFAILNVILGVFIMSKIAEFAATQSAFINRINTAHANIREDITALTNSVKELTDALANAGLSDADQELLNNVSERMSTLATSATELDDMTPPSVPKGEFKQVS